MRNFRYVAVMGVVQGLKPQIFRTDYGTTPQASLAQLAQPKRSSRALTLVAWGRLLPQRVKPASREAETAGLKTYSTLWLLQGLKPQNLMRLYAALKGRSSTRPFAGIKSCSTPFYKQQLGGRILPQGVR